MTSPATTQVGNRAVFALLAVLVALLVGGLAFAAWLRGPRGEVNPDRAWQSMAKAAAPVRVRAAAQPDVYEYATCLGDWCPVARADLATVADAKVETAYARVRLGGDRMTPCAPRRAGCGSSLLRLLVPCGAAAGKRRR